MHANQPNPDKSGLEKTADFVNYVLALGTGALVFSAELIKKDYPMTTGARMLVLMSWFLLSLSVVGGILAYMRIPVMLSESNYDLEDKFLTPPGKIQQIAFFVGIITLGIALGILLWNRDILAPEMTKSASADAHPTLPDHFVLAESAKVITLKGRAHQHTFLLNDNTGEIWENGLRGKRNHPVSPGRRRRTAADRREPKEMNAYKLKTSPRRTPPPGCRRPPETCRACCAWGLQ